MRMPSSLRTDARRAPRSHLRVASARHPTRRTARTVRNMTVKLNRDALRHAKELIAKGRTVKDERDDWSEHAPSTEDENAWLTKHGWDEYALWHLGVDDEAGEETKKRYSFPYGDYRRLHRCAIISLESRAGQYDHDDIEDATKGLLRDLDS
jgi:hypothetical protein